MSSSAAVVPQVLSPENERVEEVSGETVTRGAASPDQPIENKEVIEVEDDDDVEEEDEEWNIAPGESEPQGSTAEKDDEEGGAGTWDDEDEDDDEEYISKK